MNKEETKRRIAVMQAYVDGKEIEFYDADDEKWVTTESPLWNYNIRYRVRLMPKYRPFESSEECWNEMAKHEPFGWLRSNDCYAFVSRLSDNKMGICINSGEIVNFETAFRLFKFVDGKPFCLIEEESK